MWRSSPAGVLEIVKDKRLEVPEPTTAALLGLGLGLLGLGLGLLGLALASRRSRHS